MTGISDAEHAAQVRARLAEGSVDWSPKARGPWGEASRQLSMHAPADLARLLDRAERAERERDDLAATVRAKQAEAWDESRRALANRRGWQYIRGHDGPNPYRDTTGERS